MTNEKKPFHAQVAEKLIEQLKQGAAPWQRPWEPGKPGAYLPMNPLTGKRYKGINAIQLMSQNHGDQRWMTYKQALSLDAQVKKGEKGTAIQYWKFNEERNKKDVSGKPIFDVNGKPVKEEVKLERPRVFFATVFNAEQIEGLPLLEKKEETAQIWNAVERAEKMLQASGAVIRHASQNRAFYSPSTDHILLPEKNQFTVADKYYATALHELGHWTGHSSRLNRDLSHPFGSEGYAKEELRAEISSLIMGDELGIGHDPEQHAAYVNSWIKVLQNEPMEIFRGAADAEKIQEYVFGFEHQQSQEKLYSPTSEDSEIIEAWQLMKTSKDSESHQHHELMFNQIAGKHIGFSLPETWTGEVRIKKLIEKKNEDGSINMVEAHIEGVSPQVYGLYAYEGYENHSYVWVKDYSNEEEANQMAERLKAIGNVIKNEVSGQNKQNFTHHEKVENLEKLYLNVPYSQKEEARTLGARWDRQKKSWYIPENLESAPFSKWLQENVSENTEKQKSDKAIEQEFRKYLVVPYGEREAAKAAGASWDKSAKSWYAGADANMDKLQRFLPENHIVQQDPALSPLEEFADVLCSVGCILKGDHPIMDGQKHRIKVEGDKQGQESGFYVGHLDNHPAGYVKNNRTSVEQKWKSKGYYLSPEQKAVMHAEAANKLQLRKEEQKKQQNETALKVKKQILELVPVVTPTLYMESKGIKPQSIEFMKRDGVVYTDKEGQKTYIPVIDENGNQWSMQYINQNGTKRFAKNGRKEGCFHVVGGLEKLNSAPVIIIAEGYATAASLSEALGYNVVAAFDAGNLENVAKVLHAKFPENLIILAGDNDQYLEATQSVNPGKTKAEEAARAVGGIAIFPIFTPSESQQAKMSKSFTDFNDLAHKSELGLEGLKRQVVPIIEHEIAVYKQNYLKSTQYDKSVVQERIEQKEKNKHTQEKKYKSKSMHV